MTISTLLSGLDGPNRSLAPSPTSAREESKGVARREAANPAVRISISETARNFESQSTQGSERANPNTESELSREEQREVEKLAQRDREVRAHEAAHKAAAGSLSGGAPSFSFTTGPDGRRYATGGEVSIDTSAVSGDPDATVRKMQQVRAAALAPANPSGQDRKVAAQATARAQEARAEAAEATDEDALTTPGSARTETSAAEKTGCPVCGGEGHGPEGHDRANTPPVDLLA